MSLSARFNFTLSSFTLDVNLCMPSKGVTAIFGESGSGKTSLLRAIAGLDQHSGGQCSLDDHVWQLEQRFIPVHQRGIAMVFQNSNLFPHLSVGGNIEYAARRARTSETAISAEMAIELLGITNLLDRLSVDLNLR